MYVCVYVFVCMFVCNSHPALWIRPAIGIIRFTAGDCSDPLDLQSDSSAVDIDADTQYTVRTEMTINGTELTVSAYLVNDASTTLLFSGTDSFSIKLYC